MPYKRYSADVVRKGVTVLTGVEIDIMEAPADAGKALNIGKIYYSPPAPLYQNEFCTIVFGGWRLDAVITDFDISFLGFESVGGLH